MGTFDDYLQQQEDPLFTPIGGYQSGGMSMADDPYGLISSVTQPTEDYSTAMEQLYTPISTALPEPEGTFNTPTFSLDAASDPFSKLLNEQIKESSLISDSYSEKLAEISDRQSKLTNSAENDWSTLGAALVGGIGGLLAGGTAAEIAGGAASVGTTHYNNLEAQEKQKQALLTQDANRLLTEQKIEQSRTGQLRNTQAQAAARLASLQAQGKVVSDPDYQKRLDAETAKKKEINDAKPQNDAYADSVADTRMSKVTKIINMFPAGAKPLPGTNAVNYADAKETGTPTSKVEGGYQDYLEGIRMIRSVIAKGSQMTDNDLNTYRNGTALMAGGRKSMAEVGQAITDSEWSRFIAPYLTQKGFDVFSPTFDIKLALDTLVHDRDTPKMLDSLDKAMRESRARYYLGKAGGGVLPDFDYTTLSPTVLRGKDPQQLNFAAQNNPDFQTQAQKWFGDTKLGQTEMVPTGPPGGVAPTPTVPPTQELTREQRVQAAYERQKAALEASKRK